MSRNPYEQFPYIETEDIILRKVVPSDLDNLYEIYSNEKLFLYSPLVASKNKAAAVSRIGRFETAFRRRKIIILGICLHSDPDTIIGIAEMYGYDRDVNMMTIGYRLTDRFWGQGIATQTVRAMTDFLFNDIGLNRVQAYVIPENIKSQNVLLRNGFTKEGLIRQGQMWKTRGLVDLILFSKLRSDSNLPVLNNAQHGAEL